MSRPTTSFLDAALRIGRSLVSAAYWDADKRYCNWLGRSTREVAQVGAPITPTSAALGPDLYAGSSGVALFLAHLADQSGDEAIRAASIAAIRNATRNFDRVPATDLQPLSYYGGLIGLAFARYRVATLTGESELADGTDALLGRIIAGGPRAQILDLIGGHAGAIPALLSLARSLSRSDLRDLAVGLGDDLVSAGEAGEEGIWTWNAERASGAGISSVLLTGLAHGASGLGLALLELHAETGRADFLAAGRGAFAYEDSHFDAEHRNWPDLRSPNPSTPGPPPSPSYAVAWCHGAPGIALARARASVLDPDQGESYRTKARAALATTKEGIQRLSTQPRADATLCHGLSGLAEIAFTAGHWIDDPSCKTAADTAARHLIDRHSLTDDWPSGLNSKGPNPSLMLGAAGVGLHFLRLHEPERVPSLLWIVR